MDDYDNMYKTICRLCLSRCSADEMVSLIDNSNEDGLSCFGKAITIVCNILIGKDDNLPTMMCQKCIILLKQTIYFKLKCESTEKQLKSLVNKDVNSASSDRNIKEIVCEYVMFKQYFPEELNVQPTRRNIKHKTRVKEVDFIQKNNQKSSLEKNETDVDLAEKTYDFDDFRDIDDNSNNPNDQEDKNTSEINNILDTIQELINSGTNIANNQRTKRKIKRERRYSTVPVKERNLICQICHKVLANRLTYNHHMQRHNYCRYICDQCGKGSPTLTEMQMHQIARHGIGPYLQCDHCPYKAPRKINLIEHLRLHTGERPFTCDKCGLTFRRKAIWRNHLVCHMEKRFQCTYCPRKFYRRGSMLAHCNNVHERVYMYMCSVCSVTYTKTETVKRHMLIKHGIPREKQGRILRIMSGSSEFPGKVI